MHAGIIVADAVRGMITFEKRILTELTTHNMPCIIIATKIDLPGASIDRVKRDSGDASVLPFAAQTGEGADELLDKIAAIANPMT
ncbi:MAG TPA: hypothetical protein VK436_12735 [Methanocella sp.]|nr:hypothetical protein [Methanocella sp.]